MTSVLVVEDEKRIASFVSRALRSEGYDVDDASDGGSALALTASVRYDLVILDLLLPGIDGFEVLERLIERNPSQGVLVLSALGDVESKVRCLEIGASDYLSKPFALSELVARVKARLRRPPSGERFLQVGKVVLDPVARVADSGRGPVSLSEREFVLLQYLMGKQGLPASRQDLLSDVWGVDFDMGSNVVDVTIGRLRSKLGDDVIETVRHVGYRVGAA
jgi:two-component system OmpR family response regulator